MFVVARNSSHLGLRPMTQLRLLGLCNSLRRASNSTAETASPPPSLVACARSIDAHIDPGASLLRPQIVIGGQEKVCDGRLVEEATPRLRRRVLMTSSRRSGLRVFFERRHEVMTALPVTAKCVSPVARSIANS
jgi:hypothetical protein